MEKNTMQTVPESQRRLQTVILAGGFLALALAVQSLRIWTPLIGSIINALFILLYHRGGFHGALLLAVVTPIGAALTGVLHVLFIGMVPIIAIGNAILIVCYHWATRSSVWFRVLVPALAKSMFIGLLGVVVLKMFEIPDPLKPLSLIVLGQQFFTAIFGILLGEKLTRRVN